MNKLTRYFLQICCLIVLASCEDEVRNIAGESIPTPPVTQPTEVNPIDINNDGFDLLERMQGHWVGTNRVIADDFAWFAFDYRAISASHLHGIFEGGSAGNLLTSFFVSDFKNTRTIMARNGGLLNGIYRTSYFVLDSINDSNNGKYFRLVDAIGGSGVMYMELRFVSDSLYFNAYTSRLGLNAVPSRHMTFKAIKTNPDLAQAAATATGFPQNTPAWDFSNGFPEDFLFINTGESEPESATFLALANNNNDVVSLANQSGDPFKIQDHPYLSTLQVSITKNSMIDGKQLFLYLSKDPLTDNFGFLQSDAFDSVLKFPQLIGTESEFLFTYLHPGQYYVTVIADANDDTFISQGDITHVSQAITVGVESQDQITIDNIIIQN